MASFPSELLLLFFVAFAIVFAYILTPPLHPRRIPAAPFWITLLPLFYDLDQEDIFRQYIAAPLYTHGAIKIFFGGQWNVILQRAPYVSEVFKKEQIYHKSGNQKKIPHSLLAEFLGQQLILSFYHRAS